MKKLLTLAIAVAFSQNFIYAQTATLSEPLNSFSILSGTSVSSVQTTNVQGAVGAIGTVDSTVRATDTTLRGSLCVTQRALDSFNVVRNRLRQMPAQNLGTNTLSNTTITAGTYDVNSSLTMSGTVTLTGNSTSKFIFNVDGKLTFDANTQLVLNGGINSENIFFNVDSSVRVGDSATICGNILADGTICCFHDVYTGGTRLMSRDSVCLVNSRDTLGITPDSRLAVFGSTCGCAINLEQGDTTVNNFTMTDSVMWFRFVADSNTVVISTTIIISTTYDLILLSGTCASLNIVQGGSAQYPFSSFYFSGLVKGNNYWIKVTKNSNQLSFNLSINNISAPQNISSVLPSACDNWTAKATMPGVERWRATGFSIGTKGYIGTGLTTSSILSDFWEWDQATNVWTQKANFGGGVRVNAVGFSIGTKGYIGTGYDASTPYRKDFWEYDPSNNTWTQKANFGGAARAWAVGFSIGTKGYIGTGASTGIEYDDFWEYDPSNNSWTQKANLPVATRKYYAAGFVIGNRGYIGTGIYGGNGLPTNDFWEWNQATNSWTQKANFAGVSRYSAAGFSISSCNKGYIGAGYDAANYLPDIWEWDQASNVWTQKASLSSPTASPVGFSMGNKGYIGTGDNGISGNDFWEYFGGCISVSISGNNSICLGQSTLLTANVSGGTGPYTFLWSTGATSPSISVSTGGTFIVTVTDANGCSNTSQITITVKPTPTANFTFPANSLCINTPIQFTYTGTGAISWSWNFGDAFCPVAQNTSTLQNPSHTYTSPGQYQVYVTVTGANGCQAVFAQILNIASDCCALTVAYDDAIVPSVLPPGLTTWTVNYTLNKTIRVPANSILEIPIGRIIKFGPFGKIIVENGNASNQAGFLIMRTTSKFTNIPACPTMWQGVEVWGVSTQPSSSFQQGKIYMEGNATIENAHIGVLLGKTNICFNPPPPPCYNPPCAIPICFQPFGPYDLSKSGGFIDADGAKFNKNGTCIQFLYYTQVNTSNIRNSTLTGGVLLDPGYKTGNSYTYPNAANPYYSPHTFFGNGPRLAYLWGVRDVTFTDNIFKDSPKGIQENNAKCKVLKGTGAGNQFQNLGYGMYAQYSNTSNILFGNTVDGNSFNPTTQAISISGGQGDRITNNKFGAINNLTISQSVNNVGIYMNNSSAYTILDNDFWRHLLSIWLNYSPSLINTSPSSVIANKQADRGNFFTQCGYSIISAGDNRPVILHCNTTENNSLTSSDYINNWSGLFGTQGILSTTDYTKPAGNRFDWPQPIPKRQIATPTPFSYYAHGNPSTEYQPIPSIASVLNTNSIACPLNSHALCCPATSYIILNPSSEYYRQYISNIDQQITNLQTEFNTVFSALDKGQTAQLLTAISGNTSNGNLKNMLLQNSPLSDEVLNAFINKNETPPGNFKEVLIPNSPVTENIRPILETKLNSLPKGIANQIGSEQTNVTNRTLGAISQDIKFAKTERSVYLNQLVAFYVEKDSIQKAINLLEQEHTFTADQTLLTTYIADSNFVAAQQKLADMTATNSAEQAYLDLQEMLLNLSIQGKSVFAMDSVQEVMVRNIAAADYGLASSNACAILSLVFNEECPVQLPISTSREQQPIIADQAVQSHIDYLDDNIPNPFNNTTVIPYTLPENAEKAHINIYDVTGKLISSNEVTNKNNMVTLSANDFESGVYIYKLEMNGEILGNKKMIIIKE